MENLNKLTKLLGADRLMTTDDVQQILLGIMEILKTYKQGTESINEDTKKVVNKLLEDVISVHEEGMNKAVTTVLSEKENLANGFTEKLTELKLAIDSIKEEMDKEEDNGEEDTDDEEEKQALIEEIMAQIKLPEVKATIVSGEEIIDKINELPLDEENKIDYARLKNVPQIKGKVISGSPTVISNAVDLDSSTRANNYAIVWDATRGRYTHAASGGSGSGDVTGPASSTDNALARFDGTTGKIIQNSASTLDDDGNLSTKSVIVTGTNGGGHVHLRHQATDATATGQSTVVFADANGDLKTKSDGDFYATHKTSGNTADRTYTYPDSTGNLALKGTIVANQIAYATDTNTFGSLDTATYPTLTELSYVKGVTSAIQTQLGTKITASSTDTLTNKTINASNNTISNLTTAMFASNVIDVDTALTANSDTRIASQKAVKAYVDSAVTGLLDLKGDTDCSTNPNYPSALKGDAYYVTVAGKIGGASGKTVEVGDVYVAKADNAGGTEASVGTSWFVLNQNLSGVALTSGNLAQFAATTSSQLAGVISDETGTGALVFANSPTLVTPTLGVASATSLTTTGNIELGHASDTTLSRSSAGVMAVEGVVIPSISSTNTLTNKRITKRVGTTTSSATPTINTDNVDMYTLTAQAVDITSFTTNLSGTPTDGQTLWIAITGTAARAITWGTSFEASTVALPTTTVSTNRLDVGFVWNAATSKWRCVASC